MASQYVCEKCGRVSEMPGYCCGQFMRQIA
jgi:hypothetical protein